MIDLSKNPALLCTGQGTVIQHRCADWAGSGNVSTGSRLFELDVHLWQFCRPQVGATTKDHVSQRAPTEQGRAAEGLRPATRKQHKRTGLRRVTQVQNGRERLCEVALFMI